MHNDILLGFLLLSSSFAFSQTLEFHYDESGNQIERKPKTEEMQRSSRLMLRNAAIHPVVSEEDISRNFLVYPNPTQGRVTLEWEAAYIGRITGIELADFLGHVEAVPFDSEVHSAVLDLSAKKEGVYIINFYLDDGRRIDKKVVRQN